MCAIQLKLLQTYIHNVVVCLNSVCPHFISEIEGGRTFGVFVHRLSKSLPRNVERPFVADHKLRLGVR